MDKGQDQSKSRWAWLPQWMPGVTRLVAEKRRELGAAWVNECWRRGVEQAEPGWFYAAEGALAVGVPWADALQVACMRVTATQAVVILKDKPEESGVGNGAA